MTTALRHRNRLILLARAAREQEAGSDVAGSPVFGSVEPQLLGRFQLSGADRTALVRLPERAAAAVETRQPAAGVRPRVEADGVTEGQRDASRLARVAAHHQLSGLARAEVLELLPVGHIRRLVLERQVRGGVAGNEE